MVEWAPRVPEAKPFQRGAFSLSASAMGQALAVPVAILQGTGAGLASLLRLIGPWPLVGLAGAAVLFTALVGTEVERADAGAIRQPPLPAGAAAGEGPGGWVGVSKPMPMFALETPFFAPADRTMTARRHQSGGGREEVHGFGQWNGPNGMARLSLYRPGLEAAPPGTFFLDLARQAAEQGFSVARTAVPTPLVTKFGTVEAADIVLSQNGVEQACIGWRVVAEETALRMGGWGCGAVARPVDRLWLACFIDRLDVLGTGEDKTLRGYFSKAERNRLPQCRATRKAAWLEPDSAGLHLRGS